MLVSSHEGVAEVPLVLLDETPVDYADAPGVSVTGSVGVAEMVAAVEDACVCEAVSTVGYGGLVESAEEIALGVLGHQDNAGVGAVIRLGHTRGFLSLTACSAAAFCESVV